MISVCCGQRLRKLSVDSKERVHRWKCDVCQTIYFQRGRGPKLQKEIYFVIDGRRISLEELKAAVRHFQKRKEEK